jgi:hypothetical protein
MKVDMEIVENKELDINELNLEDCIQSYLNKSEGYPNLLVWIAEQTFNKSINPCEFFEMAEETAFEFNCWGHNSRWKNVFWSFLDENTEKCIEKCRLLDKLPIIED